MSAFKQIALASLFVVLSQASSLAAVLSGRVRDPGGKPLANVQVIVPALQRGTKTDESGSYKLENLPAGDYVVQFRPLDYPSVTQDANLTAGDKVLDVSVTGSALALTPITISAAPAPRSALTTPASVSVVEGRQLQRNRQQQVLASVQDQPGVNMIGEGYSYAKPIIRGLNSENVVVVQDGVRSEALQWGNEHGPEIDALTADRIEVMRGPNSLLYGSDALGGVISVSHAELPDAHLGAGPLSGKAVMDFQSNNRSPGQGVLLNGAQGDVGWRTTLQQREQGNFHNALNGEVPNTGGHEVSGSGAFIVRKDWGSLGVDYGRFNKRVELQNPAANAQGIVSFPSNPLNDTEFQVLNHDHGTVRANIITQPARIELIGGFDRADRNEYNSPNAPDNTPQLHWIETSYTADAKAHHAPIGPVQGTLGVSYLHRTEQSLGLAHLTPAYNENKLGEYLYEELPLEKWTFSAGVRADQTHYHTLSDALVGAGFGPGTGGVPNPPPNGVIGESRNYASYSGALGAVYHVTEPLAFAVNVGRGYRDPIPFELYAYGVHEGSGQFNIGNRNLKPEYAINTDVSIRWASQRVKGEVGVFRNYIQDYIYGQIINTGANDPSGRGLLVVQNQQSNAVIQGTDGAISVAALDWLNLRGGYNVVRGYNKSNDRKSGNHDLPHVPADNMRVGAEVHDRRWKGLDEPYFAADVRLTQRQRRVAPGDVPTAGYALLDLHTGAELTVLDGNRMSVDAGIDNVLNQPYFDYNSILKPFNIANPGRNVFVRVSVPFGS